MNPYILDGDPNLAKLEELILHDDLSNHVFLLGFGGSRQKYFVHSTGFVLSSKVEGFGNVTIEALSLACRLFLPISPEPQRVIG